MSIVSASLVPKIAVNGIQFLNPALANTSLSTDSSGNIVGSGSSSSANPTLGAVGTAQDPTQEFNVFDSYTDNSYFTINHGLCSIFINTVGTVADGIVFASEAPNWLLLIDNTNQQALIPPINSGYVNGASTTNVIRFSGVIINVGASTSLPIDYYLVQDGNSIANSISLYSNTDFSSLNIESGTNVIIQATLSFPI
jgi:hypothetical protein